MESVYGAATDPTPYIMAAYGLGVAGLLGFAVWVQLERKKLQQLLATVRVRK